MLMTGCLNEDPKGQIEEQTAYASAADVERNLVATLYQNIGGNTESHGLMGTARGVYDFNSLTTDEQIIPVRGGDWYDGGFWQRLYHHSWTTSETPLHETWNYLYKVVMLCNRSMAQIEANRGVLSPEQYLKYTSEVRAIRAMYQFYLMDMFGRVPVVTDYDTPLSKVVQSERSSVYQYILDELQQVAPYLADERSNIQGNYYGRITRPVVWFLLAKLYLNAEVYMDDDWTDGKHLKGEEMTFLIDGRKMNAWQATEYYCDRITADGYRLEEDAASNFAIHNETSRENIFTIPMDKVLYANQFWYLFRSRHYVHGGALGLDSENGTSATLQTVHAFGYRSDEQDTRFNLNFYADTIKVGGKVVTLDDGQPLIYCPLEISTNTTGSDYEQTAGARMKKYEIDPTAYGDGKLQDNDLVLFRYADVLLMKAEAMVRNGEDGSQPFNEVRERAHMPKRSCTLGNILEDRLLELMWEGWRRNDLVRFGKYHLGYDMHRDVAREADGHTTVFPIPESVIELNGKLTQNKGYE